MLTLRYSPASPYARKTRIAADMLGLSERIKIVPADTADPADDIRAQNPLGKIPTLILEDGSTLYDSRVIAEYFDALAGGGKLFPADPGRRFAALRLQALGDGVNDAALLLRYEAARAEDMRSESWTNSAARQDRSRARRAGVRASRRRNRHRAYRPRLRARLSRPPLR